jgi:hypothetical protein
MPRYEPRWVEIAERQRDNLPAVARRLVNRRIEELLRDPTGDPAATYDGVEDEWSIPIGGGAGHQTSIMNSGLLTLLTNLKPSDVQYSTVL